MSIRFASRSLNKLRREPGTFFLDISAVIRGAYYAVFFRLFRRNVRIALPFLAYARVRISGPGSVFIDRWCAVRLNSFEGLTVATLSADADVRIGKRCHLDGLTIRCSKSVTIGDGVMSANCLVQDTLFCADPPVQKNAGSSDLTSPGDVHVERGAWLTSRAIVLSGSTVGQGGVLGLASVCYRFAVPDGHVAFGNLTSGSLNAASVDRFLRNP